MNRVKLDNFELYEIDGELYSLEELKGFIESSKRLSYENERKTRFIKALKLNNSALTLERNQLVEELDSIKSMGMFEFGNRYCSSESLEADGHAFARSLLGKPMTETDIAEEECIANGEAHYNKFAFLGDDF